MKSFLKTMGILTIISALAFTVVATNYFGNNILPKTLAELIMDAACIIWNLLGGSIFLYGRTFKD